MSFILQPEPPARPNRCQLFVPGTRPELFPKAAKGAADVVTLDLEDSVAISDKVQARTNVHRALTEIDWAAKTVSVRINALDTPFWYQDIITVLDSCTQRLDLIMIPKVGNEKDVYAVDALITAIEHATNRSKRVGLEVLIETAAGLCAIEDIAASSPRLESLHLGVADYAASMGMNTTGIGGTQADYGMISLRSDVISADSDRPMHWGDPWHYPMVKMVAAARKNGILPIDGPFGDFSDSVAYVAQARRSALLGCIGKWAIHPKQVELANSVFTPSETMYAEAKRILAALDEAALQGQGATVLDGKLVDLASIRQARGIVQKMDKIRAYTKI